MSAIVKIMTVLALLNYALLGQNHPFVSASSPGEDIELDCLEPRGSYGRELCRLIGPMFEVKQQPGLERLQGKRFSEPYYGGSDLLTKLTNSIKQSPADQSRDLINQLLSGETGFSGYVNDMSNNRFSPMRGKRNGGGFIISSRGAAA